MNTNLTTSRGGLLSTIVLLLLLGVVAFVGLTHRKLLWVTNPKAAVITAAFIGMALCTRGIGRVAEMGDWLNPLAILAYLVGGIIVVITVLVVLDQNIPMIETARNALIAIIGLIGLKYVISTIHRMF